MLEWAPDNSSPARSMRAIDVYRQSDGDLTKRYYSALEQRGPLGLVCVNLFRAQKCSERAKAYRRSYKGLAYDRKAWSMDNLSKILAEHGAGLGISFGWKEDPTTLFGERASWVLYVDTPRGQVSFHSPSRGKGPEYSGEWDGRKGMSVQRILDFCEAVYRNGPGSLVGSLDSQVPGAESVPA